MRTLNPARRRIVLAGTIATYGPASDGYSAAVYGPSTGTFTVINTATITNTDDTIRAAGILLAAPGTINNFAAITAPYGEAILETSPTAGAAVTNHGRITGGAAAIRFDGPGAVRNFAYLQSPGVGIALVQGGYVLNSGIIAADTGIAAPAATIRNTGLITAGDYAISLIEGTITNAGTLQSGGGAIRVMAGAITNTGTITADSTAINAGVQVSIINAGQITGSTGIELSGALQNAPTATIAGTQNAGVYLLANSYLDNEGLITGLSAAVSLTGGGTILNAGTLRSAPGGDGISATFPSTITNTGAIYAWRTGIAATAGAITNAGSISAATGIAISGTLPATIKNTGFIAGNGADAIYATNPAYLYNRGTITGQNTGAGFGDGGTIINAGTITGNAAIANSRGAITVTNRGTLAGAQYGIIAVYGGNVTNDGAITAREGLFLGPGPNTALDNTGTIDATTGDGLTCAAAGAAINTGAIIAAQYALAFGGAATVQNTGTLTGQAGGIVLAAGGAVTNSGAIRGAFGLSAAGPTTLANTGAITGTTQDGADISGPALITNAGTITGAGIGLLVTGPATITNAGAIAGAAYGILAAAGATITNAGTIAGGAYAIQFNAYYANRLIITPGSRITGAVDGGAGVLELAAGPAAGTFAAAQLPQFSDFSALQIDQGATWDFSKSFTLAASLPLLDNGLIRESAADTLTIDSPVTGTGAIALSKHALTLNAAIATQKIIFSGTNETLALGDPAQFNAKIQSFAPGDTIDLTTIPEQSITAIHFAAGLLTLSESDTKLLFTFANPASFASATFALTTFGAGLAITLSPPAQAALVITLSN